MARARKVRSSSVPASLSGGMAGMRIFAPDANVSLSKVPYNETSLPFVGHLVPAIDDEDEDGNPCPRRFLPYRDAHGTEGLTNFFYRTPVITAGIGDDRQTFIPYDVGEPGISFGDTYYGVLFRRIGKAIKDAATTRYVNTSHGRVDVMDWALIYPSDVTQRENQAFENPRRSMRTFIAVIPLINRGDVQLKADRLLPGLNPGDPAQLLNLSGSAGATATNMLSEPISENFVESPDNVMSGYLHGDITQFGPEGKWLIIYHEGAQGRVDEITRRSAGLRYDIGDEVDTGDDSDVGESGGGGGFAKYAMTVADSVRVPLKERKYKVCDHLTRFPDDQRIRDVVLANYRPIHEYFDIPDPHMVARYLAIGFRKCPSVLYYGMADHPEFFTDEVRAILAAAKSVPTGDGIKTNELNSKLAVDPAVDQDGDTEEDDFVLPAALAKSKLEQNLNESLAIPSKSTKPKPPTVTEKGGVFDGAVKATEKKSADGEKPNKRKIITRVRKSPEAGG